MDALIMLEGVSLLCFEKFEVIFVGLDDVPTGDKKKEFGWTILIFGIRDL